MTYRLTPEEVEEDAQESKMLCAFCGAEFTPEMEATLDGISAGCNTCGFGSYAVVTVTVTCASCGKVVYKKECRCE